MTQQRKKGIILASVGVCAAAAIIFGGPFLANQLQAAKSAAQAATTDTVAPPNTEAAAIAPIETETVYDENGKIAIEPETPSTETTPDAAPADAASTSSTPTTTEKPAAADKSAAPALAQTEPKTVAKEATPTTTATASAPKQPTATTTTTEKKKSSSSSSTATKKSDTPTKSKETTSTPSKSQPKNGEIRDGKIYVEGFGWIESSGESESIPVHLDPDGMNEIVGH